MVSAVKYDITHPEVEPIPWTGCWIWTGHSIGGYGYVLGGGGMAYKLFWVEAGGVPKPGWVLDHKCRARCCVNPEHIRQIPKSRNVSENKYCPRKEGTLNEFGFMYFYDPSIHEGFPPRAYLDRHPELAKDFLRRSSPYRRRYRAFLASPTE